MYRFIGKCSFEFDIKASDIDEFLNEVGQMAKECAEIEDEINLDEDDFPDEYERMVDAKLTGDWK